MDYKSKYLDLYDKIKNNTDSEKVSVLDDVNFELELMQRDIINLNYIIKSLVKLINAKSKKYDDQKKNILEMLSNDIELKR